MYVKSEEKARAHYARNTRTADETFFENWAHRSIVGRIRVKRSKGL